MAQVLEKGKAGLRRIALAGCRRYHAFHTGEHAMSQTFVTICATGTALLLSGCEQARQPDNAPASEPGEIVTFVEKGWRYLEDAHFAAALSYPAENAAQVFVGCQYKTISFHFSRLKPRHIAPQSALVVTIGQQVVLSQQPDSKLRKDGKGYGATGPLDQQIVNGIRTGEAVVARYGDTELRFPAAPARMRALLADKCAETLT
jgi:hypothetical protein